MTGAILAQLQRYQGALEQLCQAVHNVEQLDNLRAHIEKARHTINNAAQVTGCNLVTSNFDSADMCTVKGTHDDAQAWEASAQEGNATIGTCRKSKVTREQCLSWHLQEIRGDLGADACIGTCRRLR